MKHICYCTVQNVEERLLLFSSIMVSLLWKTIVVTLLISTHVITGRPPPADETEVDKGPCSHRVSSKWDLLEVPGQIGRLCCPCGKDERVVSFCRKGNYSSTHCEPCPLSTGIDLADHLLQECSPKTTSQLDLLSNFVTTPRQTTATMRTTEKYRATQSPATGHMVTNKVSTIQYSTTFPSENKGNNKETRPTDLPVDSSAATDACPSSSGRITELSNITIPLWLAILLALLILFAVIGIIFAMWKLWKCQRSHQAVPASEEDKHVEMTPASTPSDFNEAIVSPAYGNNVAETNLQPSRSPRDSSASANQTSSGEDEKTRQLLSDNKKDLEFRDTAKVEDGVQKTHHDQSEVMSISVQEQGASPKNCTVPDMEGDREQAVEFADDRPNGPDVEPLEERRINDHFTASSRRTEQFDVLDRCILGLHTTSVSLTWVLLRSLASFFDLTETQFKRCKREAEGDEVLGLAAIVRRIRDSTNSRAYDVVDYFRHHGGNITLGNILGNALDRLNLPEQ